MKFSSLNSINYRRILSEAFKWMRLIIIALIICVFLYRCYYFNFDLNDYLKSGGIIDKYATEVLPDLESLPEYKSVFYAYHHDQTSLIFQSETMLLRVTYDRDTYRAEKEKLDEIYSFLDHTVPMKNHPDDFLMPEYEFSINSYEFRVVDRKGTEYTYYPHSFGIIATSDKYCGIAYMYFYDFDLDYISGSMADFVRKYFPYKW